MKKITITVDVDTDNEELDVSFSYSPEMITEPEQLVKKTPKEIVENNLAALITNTIAEKLGMKQSSAETVDQIIMPDEPKIITH